MDPKIKPKICINDGCENQAAKGKECPNCLYKKAYAKKSGQVKRWKSKKQNPLQKAISKADRGVETAEKLFQKGLVLWSLVVRGQEEYTCCRTCKTPNPLKTKGGLCGAHGGHYLDKANHWKLALDPDNGITQCKACNVDYIHSPKKIELIKVEMRQAMIKEKGREVVDELDRRGEEFRLAVNQGRENSKPRTNDPLAEHFNRPKDIDFIKEKIAYLKSLLK